MCLKQTKKKKKLKELRNTDLTDEMGTMRAILTVNASPFPHVCVYICIQKSVCLFVYLSSIRGEGGGDWLQPMRSQRVRHDRTHTHTHTNNLLPIHLSWLLYKCQIPSHQRLDETCTVGASGKFLTQSGLNFPFLLWLALSPPAWPTPPSLARMASSLYTENPQTSWLSLQLRTFILPPLTSAEMSTVLWSIIGLLNRILLIKSSVMCRSHIFMCPVSSRYLFLCFPIFFSHFPPELSYLRVCYVTIGHFHFDQTSGHMLLQW